MALPAETLGLGSFAHFCTDGEPRILKLQVCQSNDYYLGFFCETCGPYSRETGYFVNEANAKQALAALNDKTGKTAYPPEFTLR